MIESATSHAVLREFLDNSSLAWGLIACGTAQLSKLVIELVVHRRWRPAALIEAGGMPSRHAAVRRCRQGYCCEGCAPSW